MADVAIALPAYWLSGNEPPHLLMVNETANPVLHADNAVYTELLADSGVNVQLTELPGCAQISCAPPAMIESLDMFLADALFSS